MQRTPTLSDERAANEPLPSHMQAIVQDRYGTADVLRFEEVPRPAIAEDEVLVEVRAAGLDRGTEHLMTGHPYLVRIAGYGLTKPKNPVSGTDVAGVVVEVGSAVTRFAVGDEVFGGAKGSFAQYARASARCLAHKPSDLTFEHAAVVPVSGVTALQALTDVGHVEPYQRVLIIGASGGVGTHAVQLAKALGAEVTAVASTSKLELVRSLAPLADDFPFAASAELARDQGHRYHHENSAFGIGDGALLYSLMRHLAPRRVIEVGCGYSSALMLDTADLHLDGATEFTFIEPFPDLLHSLIDDDDRERITIRPVAVQDVDLTVFDQLEAGDICFIDSTHVSKLGSDVNRLMFDVLPRLAPGVVIHIHDIDHGFGYPDQWISEGRAWNESYLVRAFLAFNDSFEIMAWNPYLHREHREFMDTQMPMAATERGNSLWLRRTA